MCHSFHSDLRYAPLVAELEVEVAKGVGMEILLDVGSAAQLALDKAPSLMQNHKGCWFPAVKAGADKAPSLVQDHPTRCATSVTGSTSA